MSLVIEHLADVPVTRVSRWCFNCYLIDGDDGGLVVVDAGLPCVTEDLEPLLVDSTGKLGVVTATHGHPDHIGGAASLAARHGAEVYLPAATISYLHGVKPRTPSAVKLARTWPLLFGQPFDVKAAVGFGRAGVSAGFGSPRGMLWPGEPPSGGLDDGQPLPGASAWNVVSSPGHTDDSIALWHGDSQTLLSGDAVITIKGQPRPAPDTVDDSAAARTTARLRALPVEHLLPGHGLPIHARSVWR